jgi:hypothetical protein
MFLIIRARNWRDSRPSRACCCKRVADPVELSLIVPGLISIGAPRDGGCLGPAEAAERLDDALLVRLIRIRPPCLG